MIPTTSVAPSHSSNRTAKRHLSRRGLTCGGVAVGGILLAAACSRVQPTTDNNGGNNGASAAATNTGDQAQLAMGNAVGTSMATAGNDQAQAALEEFGGGKDGEAIGVTPTAGMGAGGNGGGTTPGAGNATGMDPSGSGATGNNGNGASMPAAVDESLPACTETPEPFPFFDYDDPEFNASVDAALQRLSASPAQLAAQMGGLELCAGETTVYNCYGRNEQFSTPDDTEAGVRGFKFRDGPRGLSQWEELSNPDRRATAFPASVARAATFDPVLEFQVGAAICKELLGAGWNNILAPTVNLTRHPGAGRAQESYGEDPIWQGVMGTAFVVGCQQYAQACPKHYAANNVEHGRSSANAVMDEQTLRENYTRAFEMIVRDADPACVMTAYNQVNAVYSSQNNHLLEDLLRTTFGFKGFTVSDWEAAVTGSLSAEAGLDVEMPGRVKFGNIENEVSLEVLQRNVRRILVQKFRFGWGDLNQPYQDTAQVSEADSLINDSSQLESADHLALAREVGRRGAVLLKNEGGTLPIATDGSIGSIIVLAPTYDIVPPSDSGFCVWMAGSEGSSCHTDFETDPAKNNWAQNARLGDKGSSAVWPNRNSIIAPYDGLQAAAQRLGITISYSSNAADAANADVAIIIGALSSFDEGEEWQNGADRETLDLTNGQDEFVAQAAAAANRSIVVLEGGSAITMENWKAAADAIVMAWYPGMQGGHAIAELLFGQDANGTLINFSGKLPQSWPVRYEDAPPVGSNQSTFEMGYYHGYRWFDENNVEPLYPFGYGLNYSDVQYVPGSLNVGCSSVSSNGILHATVDVQNVGAYPADEAVLAFVAYPNSTAPRRPKKEFKGAFQVHLEPGEAKRVPIDLNVRDWAYFDEASNSWKVELVDHLLMIGPHAGNLPEQAIIPVTQ